MRTNARRAVAVTVALLASIAVPGTARAQTDVAWLVGNGTYTPGLPLTGCVSHNTMQYAGTLVVVGNHAGSYNVAFSGNNHDCETLFEGSGAGTFTGVSGTATYHRRGPHSSWRGGFDLNGAWHIIIEADCETNWTSYNPVTSYTIVCQFLLDG